MCKTRFPDTLAACIRYYADPDHCFQFAVSLRWPDGIRCPFCKSTRHSFLSTRHSWQCKSCKKQFSVKVGTIFEESRLPLNKWFIAMWMVGNARNGVSSHVLARCLGITQKSAWFLLHRIRHA